MNCARNDIFACRLHRKEKTFQTVKEKVEILNPPLLLTLSMWAVVVELYAYIYKMTKKNYIKSQ